MVPVPPLRSEFNVETAIPWLVALPPLHPLISEEALPPTSIETVVEPDRALHVAATGAFEAADTPPVASTAPITADPASARTATIRTGANLRMNPPTVLIGLGTLA
jgi:hypothetical protein